MAIKHRRCTHCHRRWGLRQWDGQLLCRMCERQLGYDTRSVFERERDRQVAVAERFERLREQLVPEAPEVPSCEVVIDGQVFEVTWNGTIGRAQAQGDDVIWRQKMKHWSVSYL